MPQLAALLIFAFAVHVGAIDVRCDGLGSRIPVRQATKTSYFEVGNEDTSPEIPEGCSLESIWILLRHGSRNPSSEEIVELKSRGDEIRKSILNNHNEQDSGHLCPEVLDALSDWKFELDINDGDQLTVSGSEEMKKIAERYKLRFPEIFTNYSNDTIQFRHTEKARTKDSALAFAEVAFPDDNVYMPAAIKSDPLLRFWEHCETWNQVIDENEETESERNQFKKGKEFGELVDSMNKWLLFGDNSTPLKQLIVEDLLLMYDLCRYENARKPEANSVWCAWFNLNNMKVLEYYQDLKYWHKQGYFNAELNGGMACGLLSDVKKTFDQIIAGTKTAKHRGAFYFAHSETILPLLTLLGLYKDDFRLTAENYGHMMVENREYRTSRIGSFANNIAFELLQCENDAYKVAVRHQEHILTLDACDGMHLCDWEKFKKVYQDAMECNFDLICSSLASELHVKVGIAMMVMGLLGSSLSSYWLTMPDIFLAVN